MIQKRLRRHWTAGDPGAALWRQVKRSRPDQPLDRYISWLVDNYGVDPRGEPWYLWPVTALVLWAYDWRSTWRTRP